MIRQGIQSETIQCFRCGLLLILALFIAGLNSVFATPVTFYQSFAGNMNYVVTAGSLRTGNCTVAGSSSSPLSGIPVGATITAAYLYWAGSDTNPQTLVGQNVTFEGNSVSSLRNFSEPDPLDPMFWFSGFADVTSIVQSKRNGSYTLSGLTVETTGLHCTYSTVLAGWGLVVIYEDVSQPLRVLNLFDGLEVFWGRSMSLTPNNFVIPSSGIDGKFGVLSWEGDAANSGVRNGVTENLIFDGQSTAAVTLSDTVNPVNNQYNSTVNSITPATGHLGVDFDTYNISARLVAGDTQATTIYNAGQDLVLLGLEVLSVTNTPVADLVITKTHTGDFTAGQQGVYTITVSNNGPGNETNTVTVSDTLPAGLSYVSAVGNNWICSALGQVVTCTHPPPLANGNSFPNITLNVNVAASAAPSVSNSASVSSATFDNVAANNSSSDLTNIIVPDLSTSGKSVLDLNGGDSDPGDTLRYTITINESAGGAIDSVTVMDTIDPLLANFSVVSIPAGATDNSTPGTGPLDISGISIPANGSVTIVFDTVIAGAANPGDTISNTAVINNPVSSTNTNAVAPNIVVSVGSIPGSGIKQLYFYMTNNPPAADVDTIQRVVNPNNTNSGDLAVATTYSMVLKPSLQSAMTLQAGNIPVQIWLDRRPNNSGSRNVTVTLDYFAVGPGGSNGTLGTQTQLGIINSNAWQLIPFNINLAAPVTLNANTAIRFNLRNEATSGGAIRARTLFGGTRSNIFLNSATVINVDAVRAVNNVAYPGGVVQPSFVPNETLRIRAVVSDPFGHDDITNATIEILDPSSTPVVAAGTAMVEVAPLAPGTAGAIKTYEYVFTVPAAGPNGNWTSRVTANEGTEGTISDVGVGTFLVGTPSVSVTKLVRTLSDPVNNPSYPNEDVGANPKAIPNAIMEYRLTVTNTGAGRTDNNTMVITDALASGVNLFFGNPVAPFVFADGNPMASGLSFTVNNADLSDASDDVAFSNDGGATFITPTVDANGFDATVPLVDFIRITPKGRLNGNIGSGNPNFSIIFKVRVE